MDDKSSKPNTGDHHKPLSDEATRNKIDKHLSDIDDTISEQDIKNINTNISSGTTAADDKENTDDIINDETPDNADDNEPEKEAPTSWEILD